MKDNKNLLIGLAVAAAGYMYLNPKKKEKYWIINGQSIPESQLPSMGYVFLQGQWWSPQMIANAAAQSGTGIPGTTPGTNANNDQIWTIISQLLITGTQFIPLLIGNNNTGGTSGTGGAGGTGGASTGNGTGSSAGSSSGS
jgi:hypothetical protein